MPKLPEKELFIRIGLTSVLLLEAATFPALWPTSEPPSADTVVRELYREIVARKPLGIPRGADEAAISPLLSSGLTRRLESAQACEDSYREQHAGQNGKPEFDWLEMGLFSGTNERALPSSAVVERTIPNKDGSFRVHVRLAYKESFETYSRPPSPANAFHWHVAALVISEDGRFVVDNVLFFRDGSADIGSTLTDAFRGCDGPRWAGKQK